MEELIKGLAPAFAVGVAFQALIEWVDGKIFDPIVKAIYGKALEKIEDESKKTEAFKKYKSGIIRTTSIVLGVLVAILVDIEVLEAFEQFSGKDLGLTDNIIAGFIISMGTDGLNQIVKFFEKAKENQEEQAKNRRDGTS
jgi:large-conductance mechanosensitive channel